MDQHFFKLFDYNSFIELDVIEQKKSLIEKKVYIQGHSNFEKDENPKHFYRRSSNYYPLFLGEDFIFEELTYTLNPIFLDEILIFNLNYFQNNNKRNIEKKCKSLEFQIEFSGEFLQIANDAEEKYMKSLGSIIFQEFHINRYNDWPCIECVIRKYLSYDYYTLSEYVLGLQDYSNSYAFTNYNTFLSTSKIIELCNKYRSELIIEQLDVNSNFSTPKFIAMLEELKFFNIDSIKNLTLNQKSKIVLALLQKDYNNKNSAHGVEKNIQALNPKSELNNKKYTSWTHLDTVRKIIKEITNPI